MKVKEIGIPDIQHGKIWKVVDTASEDWLDWEVKETRRISERDIIVHSGVIIEADRVVRPCLQTKHYEDAGEVGEAAVFIDGSWRTARAGLDLEGPVDGPFLARLSTLDVHEYQKGSFDNRPEHYAKFWHYAPQIGRSGGPIPFPARKEKLPNKYLKMTPAELVEYVRTIPPLVEKLQSSGKVSKGNSLVSRLHVVIGSLKGNPGNYPMLRTLLGDKDPTVVRWTQYILADIFEDECVELIRRTAHEDVVHGIGARYWLSQHGYEFRD